MNLEKPWEHEEMAELIVKILVSCPDLMKCVVANVEPYLEPRVSNRWMKTMNFVKQIVQSMSPEQHLKPYADGLTVHQLTLIIQTLTLPSPVLKAVGSGMLQNKYLIIRYEALSLLLVMLRQFSDFITSVKRWNLIDDSTLHALKQSIMKQLPNNEMMISLWKLSSFEEDEEEDSPQLTDALPEPSISSYLLSVIDLLLFYNECFPHMLDIPSSTNFLADIENIALNEEAQESVALLQERILQLLITLDSFAFTPDKDMFRSAVHRLSNLADFPSVAIPLQARNILCTLLINTGLFEGVLNEVFVWLHCFLATPADHRQSVVKLLVDAVVCVCKDPARYTDYISQSEEVGEDTNQTLDKSQIEDVFDELLETSENEVNEDGFEDVVPNSMVILSPLLPGVLETAAIESEDYQTDGVKYFISCVIIHLLHSQTSPETLLHLVERWPMSVPSAVMTYIKGWSSEGTPQPLKKPFGSKSTESKLSVALLQHSGSSVDHILGLDVSEKSLENENRTLVSVQMASELYSKRQFCTQDPVHLLLLYKLSVFHMVQLASHGKLTETLRDKCKDALISLLSAVSHVDNHSDRAVLTSSKEVLGLLDGKQLLIHCLQHTFTHPCLVQFFSPVHRKKQSVQKLVTELVLELVKLSSQSKNNIINLSGFFRPFKQKLIHQIIRKLNKFDKNKMSSFDVNDIVAMVEIFELNFFDVVKLMENMVKLPVEALVSSDGDLPSFSLWGHLLVHLTKRFVTLHKPMKSTMVTIIANYLASKQQHLYLMLLEEHFLQYLEQFPHHLEHIPTRLLHSLLQQQPVHSSTVKLCVLLLNRKSVLIHDFISFVRQSKSLRQNSTLLFPLLSVAFDYGAPIEQTVLNKIYSQCSSEIQTAVLEPSKASWWLKCHSDVAVQLLEKCMDTEVAKDLCHKFKSTVTKSLKYEDFHVTILKCIFAKNRVNDEESQLNFVLLLLEMLINSSQEGILDEKRVEHVCQILQDSVGLLNDSTALQKSSEWSACIKMSLKFGLQTQQDTKGMLLETLGKLCDIIYRSNIKEPDVNKMFQWTLSHSEFLTVMLGTAQKKAKILALLLILVQKDPSVMSASHVPVFLSSYNATLELSDQLVLQLLQIYEAEGVSLYEYRPYLWGEAAVSHYSVKSKVGLSLWRQPQTGQVLDLLEMDTVLDTLKNFPLGRGLEASQIYKDICTCKVYDPAFFLPLFTHLLAPASIVQTHKFICSGGLALTLASLGSSCEETRAAAYQVVSKLYFHEEAIRRAKGRLLGLQFLDAIRNGVANITNTSKYPQLSSIITTFLAQTSLILPETHHAMYIPLQNFIIAKSSLDVNTVPEFFTFFHSSEIEYRMYRLWILQIIRDGMKSDKDFQVSERSVVLKLLMSFYSSVLADDDVKKLILEVIESVVRIPGPAEVLVSKNGLISWLHQIIRHLTPDDIILTSATINVVHSLWNTFCCSSESKSPGDIKRKSLVLQHLPRHILLLMSNLLSKVGLKLTLTDLRKFLHTINSVLSFENTKATCSIINTQKMFEILQVSKAVVGSVSDCEDLLMYGCKFAQPSKGTSSTLTADSDSEQAVCYLRSIIMRWLQKMFNSHAPT
ncbi:nucleolar pre-ribosomal-associated protein 1 isoform X2 [Periplaneta americana]